MRGTLCMNLCVRSTFQPSRSYRGHLWRFWEYAIFKRPLLQLPNYFAPSRFKGIPCGSPHKSYFLEFEIEIDPKTSFKERRAADY